MVRVQTVLLAGDRGHSRALVGRSKPFVEVAGKPMVVHVLEALLSTPEVSEIYVVGDVLQLGETMAEHGCLRLAAARACPVHIVPQRSSLYENVWHGFLRTLPPDGGSEDHAILVVPADIPLAIPEEISDFVNQAARLEADYVVGFCPESVLARYTSQGGEPGIEMALFNFAEGRFRPNNLHFVRPLRLGNRHYIQDMYENRYQKEIGNMIRLGWRIGIREFRHLWVLFFYMLLHMARGFDRRGYRRAADRLRSWVPISLIDRGIGALLRTRFRIITTQLGGAALDIDNEHDLEAAEKMIDRWKAMQARLARAV